MIRKLTPGWATALVTGVVIILAVAIVFLLPEGMLSPPRQELTGNLTLLLQVKIFVTSASLLLLVVLNVTYVNLYRDIPNKYSMSLLLLSFALLLYAFTSNPIIQVVFGFRPRPSIGLFGVLPDLFVGIAIIVLFYQSQT